MTNILLDVQYVDKLKSRIKELEEKLSIAKKWEDIEAKKYDKIKAERDRVMSENGKLNCNIDDLEAERDRLRDALQEISDLEK